MHPLSPDFSAHDLLQTELSHDDRSAVGIFEELRSKKSEKGKLSPDEASLFASLAQEVRALHEGFMKATQN